MRLKEMPCFRPITAWLSRDLTANGVRKPVFSENKGLSDCQISLPCNSCIGCEQDIIRDRTVRMTLESQMHREKFFLTLTYDDEHLPAFGNLHKKHAQLFIKNLRQIIAPIKIRYVITGEYGEPNLQRNGVNPLTGFPEIGRPHFHAIVYGWEPPDLILESEQKGNKIYSSAIVRQAWADKGNAMIGTNVTPESCGYVAKYINKQLFGEVKENQMTKIDPQTGEMCIRNNTFGLYSTRPGIGLPWFEKYHNDLWKGFVTMNGVKYPVPRYFEKKLQKLAYDKDDYVTQWERYEEAKRVNFDPDHPDMTPERLKDREEYKKIMRARARREKRGFEA